MDNAPISRRGQPPLSARAQAIYRVLTNRLTPLPANHAGLDAALRLAAEDIAGLDSGPVPEPPVADSGPVPEPPKQ